jgi:hypothetical protein
MRRYLNTKIVNAQLNKKLNYISGNEDKKKEHNSIRDNRTLPKNNSTISGNNKTLPKSTSTQVI